MNIYRLTFASFFLFVLFQEWSSLNSLKINHEIQQTRIVDVIDKQERKLMCYGGIVVNGYKVVEGHNKKWLEERGINILVRDLNLENIHKFCIRDSILNLRFYRNYEGPHLSEPNSLEYQYSKNRSRLYTFNTFLNMVFSDNTMCIGKFTLVDPFKNGKIYLGAVNPCMDKNEKVYMEINNFKKLYKHNLKFQVPFADTIKITTSSKILHADFKFSESKNENYFVTSDLFNATK